MAGQGGSSSSSQQYALQTGLSPVAANMQANDQIQFLQAAQQASQQGMTQAEQYLSSYLNPATVTQNASNQQAISGVLGAYNNALTYNNPVINTANQALAQYNYLQGLPAINPGPAPIAPTAPTMTAHNALTGPTLNAYTQGLQNPNLSTIEGIYNVSPQDIQAYQSANPSSSGMSSSDITNSIIQARQAVINNPVNAPWDQGLTSSSTSSGANITPLQQQEYIAANLSPLSGQQVPKMISSEGSPTYSAGAAAGQTPLVYTGPGSDIHKGQINNNNGSWYVFGSEQNPQISQGLADYAANPTLSQDASGTFQQINNAISDAQNNYIQQLVQNDNKNTQIDTQNSIAQSTYNQQQQLYEDQLNQYNQQLQVYNNYKNMSPATGQQVGQFIQNLPGYQFQQQQGLQNLQGQLASQGLTGSGTALQAISNFNQNLASQYYQNYLNNLNTIVGGGQQPLQTVSTAGTTNLGNAGGYNTNFGTTNTSNQAQAGNAASGYAFNNGENQASLLNAQGQAAASGWTTALNNYDYRKILVGQSSSSEGGGFDLGGAANVASAFKTLSNSQLKEKVTSISTKDILENVASMSLDKWQYKNIPVSHLGPYADEFKELFGVGDGLTINMVDVCGVMLASIKELKKEIDLLKGGK